MNDPLEPFQWSEETRDLRSLRVLTRVPYLPSYFVLLYGPSYLTTDRDSPPQHLRSESVLFFLVFAKNRAILTSYLHRQQRVTRRRFGVFILFIREEMYPQWLDRGFFGLRVTSPETTEPSTGSFLKPHTENLPLFLRLTSQVEVGVSTLNSGRVPGKPPNVTDSTLSTPRPVSTSEILSVSFCQHPPWGKRTGHP